MDCQMDCQMDSSVILRSGSETRRFHLACHLKQAGKGKRASFKFQVSSFQFPVSNIQNVPDPLPDPAARRLANGAPLPGGSGRG
jgi:hypothetical protein